MRLEHFVVAEDCGRLVNPMIVDGQVHGGVAQGIGAALYEEMIYDDQGQIQTASLVDYPVPSACEIPPMKVVHLEMESPTTLGGFRGMGEGGTIGAPAAIANAIADALAPLGIDINELPVTPERLFRLDRGGADLGQTIASEQWIWDLKGRLHLSPVQVVMSARDRAEPGRRRRGGRGQLSKLGEGRRDASRGDHGQGRQGAGPMRADVADFARSGDGRGRVKDFGGLDILVNNAGLVLRKRFVETTPEDWKKQIDACLYGAIHCCHAAAPHVREGRAMAGSFASSAIPRASVNPVLPSSLPRAPVWSR